MSEQYVMNRLINILIILCLCGLCLHLYIANQTLASSLSTALKKAVPEPISSTNPSLLLDAVRTTPKPAEVQVKCQRQSNEIPEKINTVFSDVEQQIALGESQLDSAATQLRKELNHAQSEREITSLLNTLKNLDRVDLPNDTLQHVLENSRDLSVEAQLYVLDFIEGSLTYEQAYLLSDFLHNQDYTIAYQAFTRLKELDKSSDVYQLLVNVSEQVEHQSIRHEANQVLATINQSTY